MKSEAGGDRENEDKEIKKFGGIPDPVEKGDILKDPWIERIVTPQRQENGEEHEREKEFAPRSRKEENQAEDEGQPTRVEGFKPALGNPVFFHV